MANYNKSFNFRNGVQVDDDNFIVNANGLVGIGTSIPTQILDVHGTTKVTGLVTTTNLAVTGTSNFYSNVGVGTAITFNSSTGIISATAFYGDGSNLLNVEQVAVDGWIVNAGNISTTSKVGIGTTLSYYSLQVGQDPLTGNGFSVDAITGNVNATGIITAPSFVGNLTGNVTGNINSIGISTFSTLKVGTGITISGGIVTATSFIGSLTGTAATTTNIPNLTGAITSSNTTTSLGSFTSAQLATALSDETGSGANVFATSPTLVTPILGSATATSITVGSGVTINSGGINVSSGIITASGFNGTITGNVIGNVTGNVTGNVVGIASTALSLSGSPSITVTNINNTGVITSSNLHIGTGGVNFTALSSGKVGIGTTIPTSEFQIRKDSNSLLEVISDSGQARISIGQSVGVGKSTAVLRFANTAKTFDIINNDTGNINTILHGGPSGVGTGRFAWVYGQTNSELASLTYDGKFGIGITDPINTFHVVGTSTVTGNANFGGNVTISGSLTPGTLNLSQFTGNVSGNINATSGVSTFNNIQINSNIILDSSSSIGIGTTFPIVNLDARNKTALFGSVGVGTTALNSNTLSVNGSMVAGSIGIGTTSTNAYLGVYGNIEIYPPSDGPISNIKLYSSEITIDNITRIGIGTTAPRSVLDFADAGGNFASGQGSFILPPKLTTSQRVGLATVEGAFIYNITSKKFQGYTGVGWTDFN